MVLLHIKIGCYVIKQNLEAIVKANPDALYHPFIMKIILEDGKLFQSYHRELFNHFIERYNEFVQNNNLRKNMGYQKWLSIQSERKEFLSTNEKMLDLLNKLFPEKIIDKDYRFFQFPFQRDFAGTSELDYMINDAKKKKLFEISQEHLRFEKASK